MGCYKIQKQTSLYEYSKEKAGVRKVKIFEIESSQCSADPSIEHFEQLEILKSTTRISIIFQRVLLLNLERLGMRRAKEKKHKVLILILGRIQIVKAFVIPIFVYRASLICKIP